MATRYYSIPEILSLLESKGLNLSTIASHVREGTIHPIVYLDSIPAHACELPGDGNTAIAVGLCYLSAYWDVGDQIIALVDNLIKSPRGVTEIEPRVKASELVGEPKILGWDYSPRAFSRLPAGMKNPKPKTEDLKIEYFVLLSANKYPADLSLMNIMLTADDFQFLRDECNNPTVQLGPHMIYHWSGEHKKVETTREYQQFLETVGWFDSPKKAFEYRYLNEIKTWTVRQASFLLCNQNPDPITKSFSKEAEHILTLIEQDHLRGVLALNKFESIRGNDKFVAENIIFIQWGLNRGLNLPQVFVEYLNRNLKKSDDAASDQPTINTASALGKLGSQRSNERHQVARKLALKTAKLAWKKHQNKTKEDIAALVLADFHEKKILNGDEAYSPSTVCDWIKEAIPLNRKKGGRPRKQA